MLGNIYFKNFKLPLFDNNNTWLQTGHEVILLSGESIGNIFGQGKPLEFLPWIKNIILLMLAVGFKPTTSQSPDGGFHTLTNPLPLPLGHWVLVSFQFWNNTVQEHYYTLLHWQSLQTCDRFLVHEITGNVLSYPKVIVFMIFFSLDHCMVHVSQCVTFT